MRVGLGLGSNLGDRWAAIGAASQAIRELEPNAMFSRVYETAPVGGPDGQGPYLNVVALIDTERSGAELLVLARRLEDEAGRARAERWGPRTLDVDVLFVGDVESDDPELTLPHPRMFERAFVLAPLAELAPDLVPAGWVDRLGGEEAVSAAARPVGALVFGETSCSS